jgi:hypothetical protein
MHKPLTRQTPTRGHSRAPTARSGLARAWTNFDREEFATRVLAHSPLERGMVTVSSASVVPYLGLLANLRAIRGDFSGASLDLAAIANGLKRLTIETSVSMDPTPIGGLPELEHLVVGNAEASDLTWLPEGNTLRTLKVKATNLESLEGLERAQALRRLTCWFTPVTDLRPVSTLPDLVELTLTGSGVSSLTPLSGLIGLKRLRLDATPVRALAGLDGLGLTHISLRRCPQLTDLTVLQSLDALVHLDLLFCTAITDICPLARLARLEYWTLKLARG